MSSKHSFSSSIEVRIVLFCGLVELSVAIGKDPSVETTYHVCSVWLQLLYFLIKSGNSVKPARIEIHHHIQEVVAGGSPALITW